MPILSLKVFIENRFFQFANAKQSVMFSMENQIKSMLITSKIPRINHLKSF